MNETQSKHAIIAKPRYNIITHDINIMYIHAYVHMYVHSYKHRTCTDMLIQLQYMHGTYTYDNTKQFLYSPTYDLDLFE